MVSAQTLSEMIVQTATIGKRVKVHTVEGVTLFDVTEMKNGQFSGHSSEDRKRIRFNVEDVAAVSTYESYKTTREKERQQESENKKYKGLGEHIKKNTGTLD